MLAWCRRPATLSVRICVRKVRSTLATVPEKLIHRPLLATSSTRKPLRISQVETKRSCAGVGPNWAPNCSGVSHLW